MEKRAKELEKITRDSLRAMKAGDTVVVTCKDGYDLDSQKSTAYGMRKLENYRYSCKSDGLVLTVTKLCDDQVPEYFNNEQVKGRP